MSDAGIFSTLAGFLGALGDALSEPVPGLVPGGRAGDQLDASLCDITSRLSRGAAPVMAALPVELNGSENVRGRPRTGCLASRRELRHAKPAFSVRVAACQTWQRHRRWNTQRWHGDQRGKWRRRDIVQQFVGPACARCLPRMSGTSRGRACDALRGFPRPLEGAPHRSGLPPRFPNANRLLAALARFHVAEARP